MANTALAWWKLGLYPLAQKQWQDVITRVTHPMHRAQAHFGLGNIALRRRRWQVAIEEYRVALVLYEGVDGSANDRVRVLNNMLVCYTRLDNLESAKAVVAQARLLSDHDPDVFREFLATQAEWAWELGQNRVAESLVAEAKHSLGNSLVV